MDVRALGAVAGLLGGLCWLVPWVVDLVGGPPDWGTALHWAGLALLGVALVVVGAGLVSRSALWLRVLVAIAFPLLAWSLYSVLRGSAGSLVLDGVLGLLVVALSVAAILAGRRTAPAEVPRGGGHDSQAAR